MAIHNEQIADAFEEIADLLEIEGANPFRVRAYRNAARSLRGLGHELSELVAKGEDLTELPGIGKDLAAKIHELLKTGHARALDQLHREIPAGVESLLRIPGLGPKRVRRLYQELGIRTIKQLQRAVRDGRIGRLTGFGPGLERKILQSTTMSGESEKRYLRASVRADAEALTGYLQQAGNVRDIVVAGSYRRGQDTVGDLDILVTTTGPSDVSKRFTEYGEVAQVVASGETRSTIVLDNGLQVDLRVVPEACFGAALHYFTGNKAHNIQVRRMGQKKGLKINEYGVFKADKRIAGKTEQSVFRAVGLPYIEPELRQGQGEIDAARRRQLPRLIERTDLRGDLHCHSRASDGHAGIREMALAAKNAGLAYLAITDHTRHLAVAHGLDADRLLRQIDEIDSLNEELDGITLLKGVEVDILGDGSLDLDDDVLRRLDIVIGALHSQLGLPRAKQTRRILRAMDRPCFTILAHPSGRLLQERPPCDIDMERVIDHARERGCFLELNSQPQRLDLDERDCRLARDAGVLVSINSDAHSPQGFDNLTLGVVQARRGWLTRADVLNTRPLAELKRRLRKTFL